jgi:hypothetical protein
MQHFTEHTIAKPKVCGKTGCTNLRSIAQPLRHVVVVIPVCAFSNVRNDCVTAQIAPEDGQSEMVNARRAHEGDA